MGETSYFSIEGAKATQDVAVYAQRRIEWQPALGTKNHKEPEAVPKELRSAVTQAGGGLIVTASGLGPVRKLAVTRVNANGYDAPERCVVLTPGRLSAVFKADGNNYDFPAGSHILVPVDEEADEKLQDFISYLTWLSPDMEALVLSAIRRPSLDHRLNILETKMLGRTSDEALAPSSESWIAHLTRKTAAVFTGRRAAMVLLVLLLAAGGFGFFRFRSRRTPDTPVVGASVPGATEPAAERPAMAGEDLDTGTPDPEPYVDEARTLFELIRAKRAKDAMLAKIDDIHFASLRDESLTEQRITTALQESGEAPVLWGLVKLQLLKLGADPKQRPFGASVQTPDRAAALYKTIPRRAVEDDPAGARFLTELACRLGDGAAPPFGGDCTTMSADDLEAGLRELITFVERGL
ncbi:MAG TPA: hypothetical protein VGF69_17170 [Thermoanaerobaculia bacterium]